MNLIDICILWIKRGEKMRLKIERIKRKWSQNDLSKKSGVCRNVISKIENNRIDTVEFGNIKKLAQALEIPVEELIKESEV